MKDRLGGRASPCLSSQTMLAVNTLAKCSVLSLPSTINLPIASSSSMRTGEGSFNLLVGINEKLRDHKSHGSPSTCT